MAELPRGEVGLVDTGCVAKVGPAWVLRIPINDGERVRGSEPGMLQFPRQTRYDSRSGPRVACNAQRFG